MSFKLSIDFTGLCALVRDAHSRRAEVILVDAKRVGTAGPHGHALEEHHPVLIANLREIPFPDVARPTRVMGVPGCQAEGAVEQLGIWDLKGCQLQLRYQQGQKPSDGLSLFQPGPSAFAPPSDVEDPKSWRDIRFVADMKTVTGDGTIDPSLTRLGPAASPQGLPALVAARALLEQGSLEAVIPSQERFRRVVFDFREEGKSLVAPASGPSQPLTDTFRWRLSMDELDTKPKTVSVEIDCPSNARRNRTITLTGPARFAISHLPAFGKHHQQGDPASLTRLHFAAFYALLKAPAPSILLPHEAAPAASPTALVTGVRPVYCPPAGFRS